MGQLVLSNEIRELSTPLFARLQNDNQPHLETVETTNATKGFASLFGQREDETLL
jgi:hypothetical protein